MKKILVLALFLCTLSLKAQDCDLHIRVIAPDTEMCGGDAALGNLLSTRLLNALTRDGVAADVNYGQLYISGRFDNLYTETLAGPPVQQVVKTSLTLMVADIFGNKVFDSETFELRGVGNSSQRAYINSLNSINGRNKALDTFVKRAKTKVIKYFDSNYPQLLSRARAAAAKHDYEQSLYYVSLIPECSKGYPEAEAAMLDYYQQHIDFEGVRLLDKAKAAFAVSPNADGAKEAYSYLNQINPSSSTYNAACKLADEIRKQTKEEYLFEVHKSYEDSHELALKKIDAAKAVGVAFGTGQAANTTNILWK